MSYTHTAVVPLSWAELGALLPCNVVVRRGPGESATTVQAIDPQTMVQLSGTAAVREVAGRRRCPAAGGPGRTRRGGVTP